jgi:hypothetical protein
MREGISIEVSTADRKRLVSIVADRNSRRVMSGRRFKLSQEPAFAAKLRDVVGLYLDPPAHSLVLSADEKIANSGTPSHPARAADEEGPGWNDDPRLYRAWHDHAVCGAECRRLTQLQT